MGLKGSGEDTEVLEKVEGVGIVFGFCVVLFCFVLFETGFLCVALAVLALTL